MNKIYLNNLKKLKGISRDVYEKVVNSKNNTTSINKTKNGKKNIIKTFKDKEIFIHSSYDPIEQAKFICENALDENADIIFLFGLGMAYEFKEMLKRCPKKKYFVVEPDIDIFKTMIENIDLNSFFNSSYDITLTFHGESQKIINDFTNLVGKSATINVKIIVLPAYRFMFQDLCNEMFLQMKNLINSIRVNVNTNVFFDKQWMLNYGSNIRHLNTTCSVKKLKNDFEGIPAIIVGAGPSLSYNIEHLKKVYNKAIIVPAGTGVSVLSNKGVKAHIAGAMDGGAGEKDIFKNLEVNKNINLFYSTQVYNYVPLMTEGYKFLMNQVSMDNYVNKKMNCDALESFTGPSITNVLAFNLAQLGCSPIILLGQDLSFTYGKQYAEGSTFGEKQGNYDEHSGFIKTVNKKGEIAYTMIAYLAVKNSMEQCIKYNSHIKFLNGTRDGLKIEGTEDIDFNNYVEEVLMKSKDYDIDKIIKNVFIKNEEDELESKVNEFLKVLKQEVDSLSSICKNIIYTADDSKIRNKKEKIIEIEEGFRKNEFYNIVVGPSLNSTMSFIFKNKDYAEKKKLSYSYVLDKCDIMQEILEFMYGKTVLKDEYRGE